MSRSVVHKFKDVGDDIMERLCDRVWVAGSYNLEGSLKWKTVTCKRCLKKRLSKGGGK